MKIKNYSPYILCLLLIGVKANAADHGNEGGYKSIFDGKSMSGWFVTPAEPQIPWRVNAEDQELQRVFEYGYVWTEKEYADFDLKLEFKLTRNCNSGLFFRTDPNDPVQGGFEIQLLDTHPDEKLEKYKLGALYDAQEASKNTYKGPGEWNTMRLKVKGPEIHVWMNGTKINEIDISKWDTAEMNPDGTKNKFEKPLAELPRTGHIGFQDHGHNVSFRNIKIKEL